MLRINLQKIEEMNSELRKERGRFCKIRDEMEDCIRKIREMSALSDEADHLKAVLDKMDEEICFHSFLEDALSDIWRRYNKTEELLVESAESCPRHYRQVEMTEIIIPVYEGGVIQMVSR